MIELNPFHTRKDSIIAQVQNAFTYNKNLKFTVTAAEVQKRQMNFYITTILLILVHINGNLVLNKFQHFIFILGLHKATM